LDNLAERCGILSILRNIAVTLNLLPDKLRLDELYEAGKLLEVF
jgi:hypothetical protein